MIKIFGLKNCDVCRKAFKYFNNKAIFIDVRDIQLTDDELNGFISEFENSIINLKSKTWKTLSESDKKLSKLELLKNFPAVMKRPIIKFNNELTIGWTEYVQERFI